MNGRVLVERLDETDGKERVLASGLVLPPKDMTLKRGRSKEIPDTFLAVVRAVSVEAAEHVAVGDEVIVHTYDQRPDTTLAGEETAYGLLVRIEDVLAVVEDDFVPVFGFPATRDMPGVVMGPEAGGYADHPFYKRCVEASRKDGFNIAQPPESSVRDLGFYRREK